VPNRPLSVLLASIAAVSISSAASAQASTQAPAAKPVAPAQRTFTRTEIVQDLNANYKAVDTNGDGAITTAEIAAAQAKARQAAAALYTKRIDETFRKLDTNKDGQLGLAEFKAGSPMPQRPNPDPARVLGEMDSNKDQKVTLTEFGAPTLANFDRVDTNRDGIVSPAETQAARAARK